MARVRRKSSILGGDPRGDTSGPAIATLNTSSYSKANSASTQLSKSSSEKKKTRSALRRWKAYALKNTWFAPLVLVCIILSLYAINPTESNPLHYAIYLSYNQGPDHPDGPDMYGKGPKDIAFVAFYTIVLSFTREFIMQRILHPLALSVGLTRKGKIARFMEQMYTAVYFAVFGPFGLYVMYNSPLWYFNTTAMFEGFPHRSHELLFKAYYLLQASYWLQQAIVLMLQLESPRKDFKELVGHHIVTLALIGLSYRFHFTYMGIGVYITHDISDFFLATSKALNYIDSPIVGPYFAIFVAAWIYCRHYLNLCILWATLTEFRTVGPYELNWETQQYKCWISQIITFSLLASLQALNLFWLWILLRVAKNYVFTSVAVDERSDDEDDEEEEEEHTNEKPVVLVNGEPLESDSSPSESNGLRERKKQT